MNPKPVSIWQRGILPRISLFGFVLWFFRWRNLRRCLFVLACLATFVALFYAEENWRGRHAWEKFKREQEAKGEKLDLAAMIPPPVPDDQNFTMTPFLAPLLDFNPLPLEPGQDRFRDTNGVKRIHDFCGLLFSDNPRLAGRRWPGSWPGNGKSDADIWLLSMRSNAPADSPFTNRLEAAAELLKEMEKYRPVMDELQQASRRPYCRFNLNYREDDPAATLLPHLAVVKRLAQVFRLRATAELVLGRNAEALADVKMIFYLANSSKDEPFLISALVRISMLQIALAPVAEGLAAHQWSDANLAELETLCAETDMLPAYEKSMRGERATGNGIMDYLRRDDHIGEFYGYMAEDGAFARKKIFSLFPRGWLYQNQLVMNRLYVDFMLPAVDAGQHRVYPARASRDDAQFTRELYGGFSPYKFVARLLMPALFSCSQKFALIQVNLDEAALACALERHRLASGSFPENLGALVPRFISAIPNDVISGQPYKYRRVQPDAFLLYSVGWNEKDDGGVVVMNKGKTPAQNITAGDWVWNNPPR